MEIKKKMRSSVLVALIVWILDMIPNDRALEDAFGLIRKDSINIFGKNRLIIKVNL